MTSPTKNLPSVVNYRKAFGPPQSRPLRILSIQTEAVDDDHPVWLFVDIQRPVPHGIQDRLPSRCLAVPSKRLLLACQPLRDAFEEPPPRSLSLSLDPLPSSLLEKRVIEFDVGSHFFAHVYELQNSYTIAQLRTTTSCEERCGDAADLAIRQQRSRCARTARSRLAPPQL